MSEEEIWWQNLTVRHLAKRAGRRLEPGTVAINKTTISFGSHLTETFERAKSVRIDEILDKSGKLSGFIFVPRISPADGYKVRAQEDRQSIQIVLPKPIRLTMSEQNLFGTYEAKIFESAPGYEDHKILVIKFE